MTSTRQGGIRGFRPEGSTHAGRRRQEVLPLYECHDVNVVFVYTRPRKKSVTYLNGTRFFITPLAVSVCAPAYAVP